MCNSITVSRIFLDISVDIVIFRTSQGLENFYFKFQDFPDFSRICSNRVDKHNSDIASNVLRIWQQLCESNTDHKCLGRCCQRAIHEVTCMHSSDCTQWRVHQRPMPRRGSSLTQTTSASQTHHDRHRALHSCRSTGRSRLGSENGMRDQSVTPDSQPFRSETLHQQQHSHRIWCE